jgi:heat-inducible transcriptional repressor
MLNERDFRVLCAVVQSYIDRPDPVGSRFVTKRYKLNFSPATIRNIMADLEEMGFLRQPHTSAGRVPTDKGYRLYVDSLRDAEYRTHDEKYAGFLSNGLEALRSDLHTLLEESSRMLAAASHCLAFAVAFRPNRTTLNRIQLFRYRGRQTAAVVITNEGLIKSKVLDSDFGLTQRELNRLSDYLNSQYSGRTIDEIRTEMLRQLSKEKALCDILISKVVAICRDAFHFPDSDVIFSGLSELMALPDLSGRINELARAMEDRRLIMGLLDSLGGAAEGVSVVIGSENPMEEMKRFSLVTASFKTGGRPVGSVGMIGPTRMDYAKAISLVGATARYITNAL